jgi:predicted PurR-regulated permease PerM
MTLPPPTHRQARLIWLALSGLALAVLGGLAVALVWGLGHVLQILSPVLWPIAIAAVLAYLLDPVVDWFERRGLKRPPAILVVFGIALLVAGALFGSVVPQLIKETRQLAAGIPAYVSRAEKQIEEWVNHPPPLIQRLQRMLEGGPKPAPSTLPTSPTNSSSPVFLPDSTNTVAISTNNPAPAPPPLRNQTLETATDWVAQNLPHAGRWLFGQVGRVASWFGVLAGLALIPVYTFYFLLEKRGISSRWTDYLPVADSAFKTELVFVLNSINNYLITFFRGQVLVAMCDGVLYGLGFLIIGLPYALLIGVVAVFLTIIPFLGAIIICLTALLLALVNFGDWRHPLLVLVVFGCVQALEGLYISPKIMGGRVGLHPVTIIISVMVGTTLLGGLLGGILAIPLTAALRVIMFRYVWKRHASSS